MVDRAFEWPAGAVPRYVALILPEPDGVYRLWWMLIRTTQATIYGYFDLDFIRSHVNTLAYWGEVPDGADMRFCWFGLVG